MRLERSGFIENDLEAIADYIAADNPRRAVSFVQEIRAKLQEIAKNPFLYRLRPEIGEEARLVPLGNYVILFRVTGEVVRLERVAHGSRNLVALFTAEPHGSGGTDEGGKA